MSTDIEKIQSNPGINSQLLNVRPSLLKHALKLTRDQEKAQDLVSDTIIRALRFQHQYQEGTSFKAWVHTVMRHVHYSQHRQAWRQQPLNEDWDGLLPATGDTVIELSNIAGLLFEETHRNRSIIALRIAGVESQDIARRMNLPEGTIRSSLFRTRERLTLNKPTHRPEVGNAYATVMAMITQALRDYPAT